jgi:linoleoyl-CoA desaturase
MSKVIFNTHNNDFYHSLKASVDEYFANKNLKKTGNWKLYLKTIILIGTAVSCYYLLLFTSLPVAVSMALCRYWL